MKRKYESPMMYMEAFVAEQYVAASDCTVSVTPEHGHVQVKGSNEIHCAFTSNNCGKSAECECAGCGGATIGKHNIITEGTNLKASKPVSGHNCHILDNHEDAVYFAEHYTDKNCGNGVAKLLGVQDFKDIVSAWS